MIGIAAGMAANGKKFLSIQFTFVVFRSLEQIRNNILHNDLDVNIIGAGGGFSYNVQGISHNTSEDISVLRSLPIYQYIILVQDLKLNLLLNKCLKVKNLVLQD